MKIEDKQIDVSIKPVWAIFFIVLMTTFGAGLLLLTQWIIT